jgi:hypothetical protein
MVLMVVAAMFVISEAWLIEHQSKTGAGARTS